jgi:hypothetical protein
MGIVIRAVTWVPLSSSSRGPLPISAEGSIQIPPRDGSRMDGETAWFSGLPNHQRWLVGWLDLLAKGRIFACLVRRGKHTLVVMVGGLGWVAGWRICTPSTCMQLPGVSTVWWEKDGGQEPRAGGVAVYWNCLLGIVLRLAVTSCCVDGRWLGWAGGAKG